MAQMLLFITGFAVLLNVRIWDCAPLAQEKLPPKEMENFMKKFGYIDSGPNSADALYTVEGFKSAVQLMQRFGGLPETGELDEATLNLTKSQRCGVPDVLKNHRQKRYIIGSKAWRKREITYFLANWPAEMDSEVTSSKLAKALNIWSEVTPLKFKPRESMDADLIVAFGRYEHGDGYPFDGRGNILAHAFFPYEHGHYGGDIHFDDEEKWIDASTLARDQDEGRDSDGVDFYTVAAHEIGHSLGLAHSTVPGSIMFPYYKGYDPNMRLDYDDIVAMYSMYVLDAKFEDEPTLPSSTTEEPRRDGDRFAPTEDDETDADRVYPTSEETPKDDDIHRSDEKETHTDDVEDYSYGADYTDYNTRDDIFTDITTELEEEITALYTDKPHSTDSPAIMTTSKPKKIPDLCEGSIDAASLIRGELFVFKGLYMWRFGDRNQVHPGYPVYFHHFLMGLPWSVRSIDAVYQRPEDYHIIFFTGRFFWIFDGDRFTSDSPRNLTDLGLPADLDKLDAALVWAKNKMTYFFSGDLYWKYNEKNKAMEKGYPQKIGRWKGVPKLDAAFTWKDGNTFFFKDKQFWRFNNKDIKVDTGFPLESGPYWFDCTS